MPAAPAWWRTHSCVQHRHSCRCLAPCIEKSLDAARTSACATYAGTNTLEVDLETDLRDSRVASAGDHAEAVELRIHSRRAGVQRRSGQAERRMIECGKELPAELEPIPLRHDEILRDRQVPFIHTRPTDGVASHIAERA